VFGWRRPVSSLLAVLSIAVLDVSLLPGYDGHHRGTNVHGGSAKVVSLDVVLRFLYVLFGGAEHIGDFCASAFGSFGTMSDYRFIDHFLRCGLWSAPGGAGLRAQHSDWPRPGPFPPPV